jgi:hypothetical protein
MLSNKIDRMFAEPTFLERILAGGLQENGKVRFAERNSDRCLVLFRQTECIPFYVGLPHPDCEVLLG